MSQRNEFLARRKQLFEKYKLKFSPFAAQGGGERGKSVNNSVSVDKLVKAYRLAESFGKAQDFWSVCYSYERWTIAQFLSQREKDAIGFDVNSLPSWLRTPWTPEEKAKATILIMLKDEAA
jgi:hypothetical protein